MKENGGQAGAMIGRKIHQFRILERLGEGGMGEVYIAYDETLERKVAIKALKNGRSIDAEAKERFRREAKVLSMLGHPNICTIFDLVEEGDDIFLVLELIHGRDLRHVIVNGCEVPIKFRILRQICEVLVAAHAKGVYHRDLKPENILLEEGYRVKVLDFGLAGIAEQPLTRTAQPSGTAGCLSQTLESTADTETAALGSGLFTRAGQIMGTLSYMSPEQARGERATASSDIFSFGLIAQELFTGRPPFDAGMDFMAKLQAAQRGSVPVPDNLDRDLAALLRRMRSVEPSERPAAMDVLERIDWLADKPRRKTRKILNAAAGAVLLVFAAAMTIQSIRVAKEAARANAEAETAGRVSDFLVTLFRVSDPSEARGNTITARELLDKGAARLEEELEGEPLVKARLMDTVGDVYMNLGLYKKAEELFENSLNIREKTPGVPELQVAKSLNSLGVLYNYEGRYDAAAPLFERSLKIKEHVLGKDDPEVAKTLNNLAILRINQRKLSDAEPMLQRALQIREKVLGPDHLDVADTLNAMARLCYFKKEVGKAESLMEQALAIKEKRLGKDHPDLAGSLNNLALLYMVQDKYDKAEPLCKRAIAIKEKVLGKDHPDVAKSLTNLGNIYYAQRRFAEAEPLYSRSLEIEEKAFGQEHPEVARTLGNLGILYSAEGRYQEAEAALVRASKMMEKTLGGADPELADCLENLGKVYRKTGRVTLARGLEERAGAIRGESK